MVKLYLIFVLLAITAVIVASRWLPIWSAALLVPATVIFFIWLTWRLVKHWWRVMMAKGMEQAAAVMRGATVTVHLVEACGAPENFVPLDDEELADAGYPTPDRWVAVEMTVRPDPEAVAAARLEAENDEEGMDPEDAGRWVPTSFSLVPVGTETDPKKRGVMAMFEGEQGNAFEATRVDSDPFAGTELEVRDEDGAVDGEGAGEMELVIEGAARVRVVFAIPAGLPGTVSLRYLTVDLGEVSLPG